MKNPRPSLALLLGAALLALPALRAEEVPAGAPPDGRREMRREKMGEKIGDRMAEELGLSADQKAKWKELGQQEKAERDALHDNTAAAKEDKRAQLEALHKSYMEKRDAILTPEQREKSKALREKMGKRMEERRGEGRPERHGPPPADDAK